MLPPPQKAHFRFTQLMINTTERENAGSPEEWGISHRCTPVSHLQAMPRAAEAPGSSELANDRDPLQKDRRPWGSLEDHFA